MTEGKISMGRQRSNRRRAVAELIRSMPLASQDELVTRLRRQGFAVTQATVSRDLDQLGAVKIRQGGAGSYVLPDAIGQDDWAGRRLTDILAEWARSIEPAGNLVVIKTPPGLAHLVGVALDQAELPDAVGTISGDDTLFIATRGAAKAVALANRLRGSAPSATASRAQATPNPPRT
jgi:transcriptional regulator of arginine metabolism